MIEFANVSASYDDGRTVLDQVSFRIEDGAFVAFVGSNGAGKSTTMRLVNGLLKPTAGEVLIDGASTCDLKTSELARRVGFLFQNPDRQRRRSAQSTPPSSGSASMRRLSPTCSTAERASCSPSRRLWRSIRPCSCSTSRRRASTSASAAR